MIPDEQTLQAAGWKRRELPGYIGVAGPLWTRRESAEAVGPTPAASPARWAYAVLAGPQHLNPAGIVHGGALLTLLDHAVSTVAWEASGRMPCVTLQLDTHFVAAVRPGELAEARAHVVERTGGLLFMRGEVSVAGRTVLTGQALMKLLASAPAPAAGTDGEEGAVRLRSAGLDRPVGGGPFAEAG